MRWLIISAVCGFTGVAAGAFGAHSLKTILSPKAFENFKTGVLYQLFHSTVLLAVSISGNTHLIKANKFFLLGIILFSFSLYAYSLTSQKFFAMVTPFGGVSFLMGWGMLAFQAYKYGRQSGL